MVRLARVFFGAWTVCRRTLVVRVSGRTIGTASGSASCCGVPLHSILTVTPLCEFLLGLSPTDEGLAGLGGLSGDPGRDGTELGGKDMGISRGSSPSDDNTVVPGFTHSDPRGGVFTMPLRGLYALEVTEILCGEEVGRKSRSARLQLSEEQDRTACPHAEVKSRGDVGAGQCV